MPFDAEATSNPTPNANRRRLGQLRDHIHNLHPADFSMRDWHTCIAGHCCELFELYGANGCGGAIGERATRTLGLSRQDAALLFLPPPTSLGWVGPKDAAAVIDHYLETGTVDWTGVLLARKVGSLVFSFA